MARISRFMICISLMIIMLPSIGQAYILPSSQILEFMTDKFAHIRTVKIIQQTRLQDPGQEKETVFGELLYLMSPYFSRSEMVGQPGKRLIITRGPRTLRIINGAIAYDGESQDLLYRFLLLAQRPTRLLEGLRLMGINVDTVSLTRLEGRIAFVIGEKKQWAPRLLVDKDLFLPLLLEYGNRAFRFSDYRKTSEETWYPYKIVCSVYGAAVEEYSIREITVNPPLDLPLFDIPLIKDQYGSTQIDQDTPEPKIQLPEYPVREGSVADE